MRRSTCVTPSAKPVVQLIATVGTIATKAALLTKGIAPATSVDDRMQTVPNTGEYATIEENYFSAMSANYVNAKWWTRLTKAVDDTLARPEVNGVVVRVWRWLSPCVCTTAFPIRCMAFRA